MFLSLNCLIKVRCRRAKKKCAASDGYTRKAKMARRLALQKCKRSFVRLTKNNHNYTYRITNKKVLSVM